MPGSYRLGLEREVLSRHGARVRRGAQAARHAGGGGLHAVFGCHREQTPLRGRLRQGGAITKTQKERLVRLTARCRDILVVREQGQFSVVGYRTQFFDVQKKTNRYIGIYRYIGISIYRTHFELV